MRFNLTIRCN